MVRLRHANRISSTSVYRHNIHVVEYMAPMPMAVTLGEFEQLVLLALVRLGPDAYGATVRREIEEHAGREVSISAVYTTLERLEQKGLVRSRIGAPTPERGGRRRRHFELLPLGARSLRDAYRALAGMTAGIERRLKTLS
jgi:PadR family transcriptional regulator, regulatory protein PadR